VARPTKPKDLKAKGDGAELAAVPGGAGAGGGGLDLKMIILGVVLVIASIGGSVGASYLMTTMFVVPQLSQIAAKAGGGEGGEHGDAHGEGGHGGAHGEGGHATPQVGMNLELDEFTVNLKPDEKLGGNQYLRAKMALSVKVPDAENCYAQEQKHARLPLRDGAVVALVLPENAQIEQLLTTRRAPIAADGTLLASGGSSAPSCEDVFKKNMGKLVPTARDVINAALMKRTASQLASLEGQEALKDEIKEQLNSVMAPTYEVLRVNFQDFIIQR